MNYKICLITWGVAIAFIPMLANASASNSEEKLNSESKEITSSHSNSQTFSSSFKPPNRGQPKYTVGGATRGNNCAIEREGQNEITALVTTKDRSLTLQSHPSLFAYVSPKYANKTAILVVKDETEDYYHSQRLTIPASGGIIKTTLAENAPQLEVNKEYTWFLRIQCNTNLEPEDPQISASIMRVEGDIPDLNQSDLVSFYADSQIWYDSLNNAFKLYQYGEDVYWIELLNNIGLARLI